MENLILLISQDQRTSLALVHARYGIFVSCYRMLLEQVRSSSLFFFILFLEEFHTIANIVVDLILIFFLLNLVLLLEPCKRSGGDK